ncbi:MAG: DoxX family protein [Campylobacterota bacterium]|nr:DoxX family protein [Campylobacterota bacterium]
MDSQSIGKLILRIAIGGLLLFHGVDKILHGIGYIESLLKIEGLPPYLAFGVYVGEILAPLMLLVGWRSRWWASIIAFNMAVAIYLVHSKSLLTLGSHGSWSLETPVLFLMGALAIIFLGSGKYAISKD